MQADRCQHSGCLWRPGNERHNHRCNDLNEAGEKCWTCHTGNWWIRFGSLLPAMIYCADCGAGFNVSQRLQATTTPRARIER